MSYFGEPTLNYSYDDGKTSRTDGPLIGPNVLLRVMTPQGKVLWQGRANATQIECRTCNGTGYETKLYYVEVRDEG